MDRPYRMFGMLGVLFVSALSFLIWAGIQDQKRWDAFAATHACKLIAHQDGYSTYGYFNGKYQSYYVPSRNTFHCNDGVDYTR